jgi:succinoglycan biosynthesis protein ExoA
VILSDYIIVVPCLNEQPYIANLLDYLVDDLKVTSTTHQPLIIVADGGSTDGTKEIIQTYANQYRCIKYLYNERRLQCSAVNRAVEQYGDEAKYLIRLDVHADYPSNYVSLLLKEAEEIGADSVVVSMDTQALGGMQSAIAAAQSSVLGNGGSDHRNSLTEGQWIDHGHHALISINGFKQINGYDESFSHNEDAEFDYRFGQAGFKIWLTAKTNLVYYPRETLSALFRQYKGYGRGRAKNIIKHGVIPKIRQLIPMSIFPLFLFSLFALIWWPLMLPFLIWFLACFFVGGIIGHKTMKGQGFYRYLVGIAAIVMHFAWSLGFCSFVVRKCVKRGDR